MQRRSTGGFAHSRRFAWDRATDEVLLSMRLRDLDGDGITDLIVGAARASAGGRIVSALEGGYDLDALARSVGAHIEGLLAAQMVAATLSGKGLAAHCTNVAEGFEGDLDQDDHRGGVNGWKARGLPWRQN